MSITMHWACANLRMRKTAMASSLFPSLLAACTIGYCLQPGICSYLGYPRLHFYGHYRADTNTRNNQVCNYHTNKALDNNTNDIDWGFNGTNEIQFFDARVTSVAYKDGTTSTSDPVVGCSIIGNTRRPFAKLVDLDVDAQMFSSIYGLNFGVGCTGEWDETGKTDAFAFYGKWTRNVIAQFMWQRVMCYSEAHAGNELYQTTMPTGVQSTTTVTDVEWNSLRGSRALMELRDATGGQGGGALAVRISLSYYTRNYPPYVAHNATLGYVSGVIGVPSPSDTLNVPGQRAMFASGNLPMDLVFKEEDLCFRRDLSEFGHWMHTAPFEVDEKGNEVRLDLSNSLPTNLYNTLRDIGTLHLGFLTDASCVHLLGSSSGIPYTSNDNLEIGGGIFTVKISMFLADLLRKSPLVLAQVLGHKGGSHSICGDNSLSTKPSYSVQVLLLEYDYYIRPVGYYLDRLEKGINYSSTQSVYVTKYGVPVSNFEVIVNPYDHLAEPPYNMDYPTIPQNGVLPSSWSARTNESGLVTFDFLVNPDVEIHPYRTYPSPPCVNATDPDNDTIVPVDGQVYYFYFCGKGMDDAECKNYQYLMSVMLVLSEYPSKRLYTWVKDVGPILSQYAHISKVMSAIVDLSSYHDVTRTYNLNLIRKVLSLDFNDPSYMPTTRDLSTSKRRMIMKWLDDPKYNDEQHDTVPTRRLQLCKPPDFYWERSNFGDDDNEGMGYFTSAGLRRCTNPIRFMAEPSKDDPYFSKIMSSQAFTDREEEQKAVAERPLLWKLTRDGEKNNTTSVCTKENVMTQLQTAIELEWMTIIAYLTSLYSIVEGCNMEIYELVRSVIMQEMLHMTQSANTLIAMGGSPLIDSASVTPSFPTRLPGGVLPGLEVSLERLSLRHVHDVFMGIEVAHSSPADEEDEGNNAVHSIGAFYEEISDCILKLGDGLFIDEPVAVSRQVKWPWRPELDTDDVILVVDSHTAVQGLKVIIIQGEGAELLHPGQISNNTAISHFFRFEEAACQHRLVQLNNTHYGYRGAKIPFDPSGVWPMRTNPKADAIPPHTNCYTESKVFHKTYRKLLRKLQEVFNGSPEDIFEAVQLMESLQVHAKKLMWTELYPEDPADDTTCGPIWDYNWPGELEPARYSDSTAS